MAHRLWITALLSLSLPVLAQSPLSAEVKVVPRACYIKIEKGVRRAQLRYEAEYLKAVIDCHGEPECVRAAREKQARQLDELRKKEIDDILLPSGGHR
jgi:hypothetical protein